MFVPSKELAEEHYKDLSSKPFFKDLVSYIISGPVVAMVIICLRVLGCNMLVHPHSSWDAIVSAMLQVWEGYGVVASARKLIGATNPLNAEPGTIRGDLAGN